MITRRAYARDTLSEAVYSDCESYRYTLTRIWADGPRLTYVMLNPSTATEAANDPTIERCERRARALGYGAMRACNLFALRETDPAQMRRHPAPTGPDNDQALRDGASWADAVLCAWGVHGVHLERDQAVKKLLTKTGSPLIVLGLTKHGHPRHPLYVSYQTAPMIWRTLR